MSVSVAKRPNLLIIAISSLLACSPSLAEEFKTMDVVTVGTATKTERPLSESTVSVAVITEADIQAMGVMTLADIFLQTPDVFMNPGKGEMSIRGAGAKGTLMLIDGRRMSSEFTKNYDGARIPASSIERIEIVKGPASVLYGTDSLGGVVNIITKSPTKEGIEGAVAVSTGANPNGQGFRHNLEADVRGKKGDTGFSGWMSIVQSQGFMQDGTVNPRVPAGNQGGQVAPSASALRISPTGQVTQNPAHASIGTKIANQYDSQVSYSDPGRVLNLGGKLEQQFSKSLQVGADVIWTKEDKDSDYIADNYVSGYTRNGQTNLPVFSVPVQQSLDNTRLDTTLRAKWQATDKLLFNWRTYRSWYEKKETVTTPLWKALGFASQGASSAVSGSGDVEIIGHEATAQWKPHQDHRLLAGMEHRNERRSAAFFSGNGTMSTKTYDFNALFAQHEWQVTEKLGLVYGARQDRISTGEDATSGSIGAVYKLHPLAIARASVSQGFRAPDMQELYINRFNPQGSRFVGASVVDAGLAKQAFGLKPERSQNMELGLSGSSKGWHYDIALFRNEIEDSIQRVTVAPSNYISFRNESQVTLEGLDAKLGVDLSSAWRLQTALTLMNSKSQTTGKRLEYTPNQLANVMAIYRPNREWRFTAMAQYVGDQEYTDTRVSPQVRKTTDAYTPVNLKVSYMPNAWKETELFGGIDNVFDAKLDSALGYQIGTYAYAGVRKFF